MYQAAIFDLDGTLLYTLPDLANACNYALAEIGLPLHKQDEYREMLGNGKRKLVERMLPKGYEALSELAIRYFDSYYKNNATKETVPYDGMVELLEKCKKKKIKLGVLSNKPDNFTQTVINYYFPNTFDFVYGGDFGRKNKPDPTSLLEMLKKMKVEKKDVLYIGDSDVDMQTALNAKIDACGVLWGYRNQENIMIYPPRYIVKEVKELEEILCPSI